MIPILYPLGESEFQTNGIGRLSDCITCTVTEERNGQYEAKFTYPITGIHYPDIKIGSTIVVIHDDTQTVQPFDVYRRTAPINGVVTFYARHISYRLNNVILTPYIASSCVAALNGMQTHTYYDNPFTFWTDKATQGNFHVDVPSSVRSVLGGVEGSILDVYGGGEYEWDGFTVKLHAARGNDSGVTIRYGVNLTDITQDRDGGSSYSAVVPYWASSESGTLVTLPEGMLIAGELQQFRTPLIDHEKDTLIDHDGNTLVATNAVISPAALDLSEKFSEQPTVEQLRQTATTVFSNSGAWKIKENIEIDFVALWQTEEYKNVAALQRVGLCDTVNVVHPTLGIFVSAKVIKTVYNVLAERYDEMELGEAKSSMSDAVRGTIQSYAKSAGIVNRSMLAGAVAHATDLITGGLGGFLVINTNANGEPEELLIMDTPNKETAVNVWRFNSGGLGHSHNGYNGPFDDVALTADGQINASMVTTGILNANLIQAGAINADLITTGIINGDLIRAGLISDYQNSNYWNLATGYFTTKRGTIANFTIGSTSIYSGSFDPDTTGGVVINDGYIGVAYDDSNANLHYKMQIAGYGITINRSQGSSWEYIGGLWISQSVESGTSYAYARLSASGTMLDIGTNSSHQNGYVQAYGDLIVGGIGYITGDLRVGGSKSRQVSTHEYSDRLLYAYETPSPMFGDVGEGTISDDGLCYVWIDPIFSETINTSQYQVFLQKYGDGDCFVKERQTGYFVVQGTPGMSFGWEIKAKQRDYEQNRLDIPELIYKPGTTDYGALAEHHIQTIQEARNLT